MHEFDIGILSWLIHGNEINLHNVRNCKKQIYVFLVFKWLKVHIRAQLHSDEGRHSYLIWLKDKVRPNGGHTVEGGEIQLVTYMDTTEQRFGELNNIKRNPKCWIITDKFVPLNEWGDQMYYCLFTIWFYFKLIFWYPLDEHKYPHCLWNTPRKWLRWWGWERCKIMRTSWYWILYWWSLCVPNYLDGIVVWTHVQ